MIIDFHTHIFPSTIRNHKEKYFSSEAGFKLLYRSPKSKMVGARALLAAMDENGVQKSVVFGFPWKEPSTAKLHNDYIMEMVAIYNTRLIGFCCLDPCNEHAAAEATRCIDGGLSGIGELACYDGRLDKRFLDRLDPLMEICRDKDLPTMFHTSEPIGHAYSGKMPMSIQDIYRLVGRYNQNKIVLAHWGGGILFYGLLKKEVRQGLNHVYYDTAASPYLYDPLMYNVAMQVVQKDRILFGSDFPLIPPRRYFKEMESSPLSKGDQRRICGENAVKLLKLKN